MPLISVITPVYKQMDRFVQVLASNLPYLEGCEIIVVNDDPDSHAPIDTNDAISNRGITWINNTTNQGFGVSVNTGALRAQGDLLLLLNSDVKLSDASWRKTIDAFQDATLFAVCFAQRERDGRLVGRNELSFSGGLYQHRTRPFDLSDHREYLPTSWAEGGAMIVRTSMWRKLGGFDPAYSPFYWEDIDLSYRARQKGWGVLFAPHVVVEHHHQSTIGVEFASEHVKQIAFRNQLYFTHKFARGFNRVVYLLTRFILLPLRGYNTRTQ